MKSERQMISVCGIDCSSCNIRKAPNDPEAAERIVAWFKREGWLKEHEGIAEIVERGMYCNGCRGDRSVHWSPDCWILKCCVEDKGHDFCYQCDTFPCDRLLERAKQDNNYNAPLERLKKMKKESEKR